MNYDELRRLAENATRGPWVADGPIVYVDAGIQPHVCEALIIDTDAAFIAAASPDVVIALLDRIKALEVERDARPAISREDVLNFMDLSIGENDPRMLRVFEALRAHAAKGGE